MATSTIGKQYKIASKTTASATSINKQSQATINLDVSESGWQPLGIIGVSLAGATSGYVAVGNHWVNENTEEARVALINTNTANSASITTTLRILYIKR